MYFHSINQSDYINAIKKELVKIGLIDINEDEYKTIQLKVKKTFYKVIFINMVIFSQISKLNKINQIFYQLVIM